MRVGGLIEITFASCRVSECRDHRALREQPSHSCIRCTECILKNGLDSRSIHQPMPEGVYQKKRDRTYMIVFRVQWAQIKLKVLMLDILLTLGVLEDDVCSKVFKLQLITFKHELDVFIPQKFNALV